ncbi:hypothetical protein Tco_0321976 [Tanacetum coccineum]
MATPFANPERQFRARRDTSPAPIHNIYTFYESKSSESEFEDVGEIDTKSLTLEQYLALNLNNTHRRISNPEDATFEIKGQYLRELHKTTFSGSSTENAIEHIEKLLEVASLFNTNDSALLRPNTGKQEKERRTCKDYLKYEESRVRIKYGSISKKKKSYYSSFQDLRSSCNEDMVKYEGPRPSTTQA